MYRIKGDGILIYDNISPTESLKAISPNLTLKDNAAGSLEITLPNGNPGYSSLSRMKSVITVYKDNAEIWSGRIVSEQKDFQNNRILTCEGELSYLNDTIQPPKRYSKSTDLESDDYNVGVTVAEFLDSILTIHNTYVDDEKKFYIQGGEGYIFNYNESMPVICTNYENTLECINENLIERYGGHLVIEKATDENGVVKRYLNYIEEGTNTNTQVIRFGQNLLDFTQEWDLSDFATVIIPRGARLDESDISEDIEAYVTIEGANLPEDSDEIETDQTIIHQGIYLISREAVKSFGRIEKIVDFEDIEDPDELYLAGLKYLTEAQFEKMILELTAVDLEYLNIDTESIKILDQVRCISRPHGLNALFPVTEMSIQLDKPESAEYTLGITETKYSLSESIISSNLKFEQEINSMPTKQSILTQAKDNANALITSRTNGFVTILTNDENDMHSEALVISSERITGETSLAEVGHYWIWNVNGLAHYSNQEPDNLNVAITMDGHIVADYVTTGTMSADRIRTGLLKSEDDNVVWNLNEEDYTDGSVTYPGGSLTIKKGSIAIGEPFGNWEGSFCVDQEGNMVATKGNIGGFTIDAYDIYNDVMRLNSDGLSFYIDNEWAGRYGTNHWNDRPSVKGLTVDVETHMSYIAWGYKENISDDVYTVKLMYTCKAFGDYEENGLYLGCNLYLGTDDETAWMIKNAWIDPYTCHVNNSDPSARSVLLPTLINQNTGTVQAWRSFEVRNGFLLGDG